MSNIKVGSKVDLSKVDYLPAGSVILSSIGEAWQSLLELDIITDEEGNEYTESHVSWHSVTDGLSRMQDFDAPFTVLYVGDDPRDR